MPFLSFEGITHGYLLEISITHYKKQIPLLNLLINCISARSQLQILYLKDEYMFCFLDFLIIGLCNSSANSLFDRFSFLTASPEVGLSKTNQIFYQNFINH